jgi:hypothetical protein
LLLIEKLQLARVLSKVIIDLKQEQNAGQKFNVCKSKLTEHIGTCIYRHQISCRLLFCFHYLCLKPILHSPSPTQIAQKPESKEKMGSFSNIYTQSSTYLQGKEAGMLLRLVRVDLDIASRLELIKVCHLVCCHCCILQSTKPRLLVLNMNTPATTTAFLEKQCQIPGTRAIL